MEPSERDLEEFQEWWTRLSATMPEEVKGLWFGVTVLAQGERLMRALYVAGCPTFDPDDETGEWATEYCWWPTDRYVMLADFAMLPERPYQQVLDYAAALVGSLQPTESVNAPGVAVGFDDGDLVVL